MNLSETRLHFAQNLFLKRLDGTGRVVFWGCFMAHVHTLHTLPSDALEENTS